MENISPLELLKNLNEKSPGMIYLFCLYPDGRVVLPYVSQGVRDLFGLTPEDVKLDGSLVFNKVHPQDVEGLLASIQDSARSLRDWKYEYRVLTQEGKERWLLGNSRPQKMEDGSILWTGYTTDISLDKKNEFEFLKTTRLFAVTAKINEMILYSKSQQGVFQEACRIATEQGEFQLAWVGLLDPQSNEVVTTAHHSAKGIIASDDIKTFIQKNFADGKSLKDGKAVTHNTTIGFPGGGSSLCIPIRAQSKVIGLFGLLSSDPNFFTKPEIDLLEKIAKSISFAIDAIDTNEKRTRAEIDLKKALTLRDEFISIASHELKTPLTSMQLQLQMLQRVLNHFKNDPIDEKKIDKSLLLSINQIRRMNSLIENLLDVTRIQSGKLDFQPEEFDASEVLKNVLESFQLLIQDAGCEVITDIKASVICFLDKGKIEQVFINLISNAVKYAPGCKLTISLMQENDSLIFHLHDEGPGIPLDKQADVFERFQRGSASLNISGLGLGLYITKQIIDSHHGEIKLESGPGAGTSFIVKLPLHPVNSKA